MLRSSSPFVGDAAYPLLVWCFPLFSGAAFSSVFFGGAAFSIFLILGGAVSLIGFMVVLGTDHGRPGDFPLLKGKDGGKSEP